MATSAKPSSTCSLVKQRITMQLRNLITSVVYTNMVSLICEDEVHDHQRRREFKRVSNARDLRIREKGTIGSKKRHIERRAQTSQNLDEKYSLHENAMNKLDILKRQ